MKISTPIQKAGAFTLCAAIALSCGGLSAMAASSVDISNAAVDEALAASDIIDYSKTGSITIYKYDSADAGEDGIWAESADAAGSVDDVESDISAEHKEDDFTQSGISAEHEADDYTQSAIVDYAVEGVEFSYVYLGAVEMHRASNGYGASIAVVYEIDEGLADILGLGETDAYDMGADVAAYQCVNNKLHFDSTQLNDALKSIMADGNTAAKNALEAYAQNNRTGVFDKTNEAGYTYIEGLALGLYLIVETAVPEDVTSTTDPWLASVPFTDASGEQWIYDLVCYPKNQTGDPTLDKLVRNAYGAADGSSDTINGYNTDYIVSTFDDKISARDAAEMAEGFEEYRYSDTTTASMGDVLDYIIVSKLPTITSVATYLTRYTFEDELSAGIEYNKDLQIAIYDNEIDAYANNPQNAVVNLIMSTPTSSDGEDTGAYANLAATGTVLFAQDYVNVEENAASSNGGTKLSIGFTEKGLRLINEAVAQSEDVLAYGTDTYADEEGKVVLNEEGFSGYYIVVYYSATVGTGAQVILGDEGNPNDVTLTWERTSEGYADTLEDKAVVYSYGLEITKRFSDDAGDFENVGFTLYNATDGYYVAAEMFDSDNNIYYIGVEGLVADTSLGKSADRDNATVFIPGEDGKIYIYGLEADTYELTEITTDEGYRLLSDSVTIAIEETKVEITPSTVNADMAVGEIRSASADVDSIAAEMISHEGSDNALVPLSVNNEKIPVLPQTRGTGTLFATLTGCGAVFAGIMIATSKKRPNGSGQDGEDR